MNSSSASPPTRSCAPSPRSSANNNSSRGPGASRAAARKVAADMLAVIEKGGEHAVRDYASKLDGWSGDIVLDAASIERQTRDIPQAVKDDIAFAASQVRRFADEQRASVHDFALENY